MALSILVTVTETFSGAAAHWRIVPPAERSLQWNDSEKAHLAVNMIRCAMPAVKDQLGSTWTCRIENGGMAIESPGAALKAHTTRVPAIEGDGDEWIVRVTQAILDECGDGWRLERA
jgi:hypothetical protein